MDEVKQEALELHKKMKGKIKVELKDSLADPEKLKLYYTPGVGAVSTFIAKNPELAPEYTWLNNSVAVVSDGSSVLGLGDIGPLGALPVMEGKCMLFKQFAGIDAVPIVLNAHSVEEIVATVKAIAPSFGAINLEDIAAPKCFEIEERLKQELSTPVMHDDQHGTAVVVLAGLINAMKVKKYVLDECKIVIVGAGAAGTAIAKLLRKYGANDIVMVDSKGIIGPDRADLDSTKQKLLEFNEVGRNGSLQDALEDAHIFIGVSRQGLLAPAMIKTMAKDPVIFALANPEPEIYPDEAKKAGALIVATGRSDFPNQVNNALAFPGIFRGALDNRVNTITEEHKIKTAEVIASFIKKPTPEMIIPSIFERQLVGQIANVIT